MNSTRLICLSLLLTALFSSCGDNTAIEQRNATPNEVYADHSLTVHLNEGIRLWKEKDFEAARQHLRLSSGSEDVLVRAESFFYLNALEMELQNYDSARVYLQEYHHEALDIFYQAVEAEKEIRLHKENISFEIEVFNKSRNRNIIALALFGGLAIVLIEILYLRGRLLSKHRAEGNKARDNSPEEDQAFKLTCQSYLIQAEVFKQTPVYAEIIVLAEQKRNADTKILNFSRQEVLNEELRRVFSEFIKNLKEHYPLTDNDIKLCCLSLLPLSTFSKALCYGSTEVNIIKQRKHHIKKKMGRNSEGILLFGFIFESRIE